MPSTSTDQTDSPISGSIVLGKYYAWRGGHGKPDEYSRTIVLFKSGVASAVEFFTGKVARRIESDPDLNQVDHILIPAPSSKAYDPLRPHKGERLCQAVAAVPRISSPYGNYLIRHTSIRSSHAQSVSTRPSIEEHLSTIEVRIPTLAGKFATKLGGQYWKELDAIVVDDVRYFGATTEACAIKLLEAGFRRIYAIYLGQNQP